jgi:hypothetical protein
MKAYKLLRKRKDGSIGPLFINRKARLQHGDWLPAESHPTKGFAYRPFWHCTSKPIAPHLSVKDRVWCLVEIEDFVEMERPKSQGGRWYLANRMKIIKEIGDI